MGFGSSQAKPPCHSIQAEAEAAEEQSIAEDEAEALFGGEAEPQPGAEEEEEQPEEHTVHPCGLPLSLTHRVAF